MLLGGLQSEAAEQGWGVVAPQTKIWGGSATPHFGAENIASAA